jgi:uncharacterized delta-60 repeat protein
MSTNGNVRPMIAAGDSATLRALSRAILLCGAWAGLLAGATGAARAAAPGSLDSSFGSGGIAASAADTRLFGTAVQSDGKVLAVGEAGASSHATMLLVRFTSTGSLDRSFGANGVVRGPAISGTPGAGSLGRGVAIQRDGRIVVVGKNTSSDGSARDGLLVERFNSNGSIDKSFGSGGVVNLLTGNSFGDGYAVAVQPDGRIVATGTADTAGSGGTTPRVAVVRLNENGSLDTSFGSGGIDRLNLGAYSYALTVALQSDHKIVIAGSQAPGLQVPNALIARLTPSGALDRSFAGTGAYAHQYARGAANSGFTSLAIQPNGSIVAAGTAANGNSGADTLVVRFNASGAQDRTFGSGGVVSTSSAVHWSFGSTVTVPGANGVALSPNGDIVVAGSFANSIITYATVWALTSRGSLAGGFGHSGAAVLTNSDGNNTEYSAIALSTTSGDFVVAGDTDPFGGSYTGIAARYIGFGPPPSPPLKLSLNGVHHSYKTSRVAKHGLKLTVGCNEACKIKVSLTVSTREARKLHLKVHGKRPVTLARASATLRKVGRKTFVLRLSKQLAAALHNRSSVPVTLVVSATGTVSHKGHTIRRGMTLTS